MARFVVAICEPEHLRWRLFRAAACFVAFPSIRASACLADRGWPAWRSVAVRPACFGALSLESHALRRGCVSAPKPWRRACSIAWQPGAELPIPAIRCCQTDADSLARPFADKPHRSAREGVRGEALGCLHPAGAAASRSSHGATRRRASHVPQPRPVRQQPLASLALSARDHDG